MKKKMVFHFYCDEEWETNSAVKLHMECIKYYSHLIDDMVVVIATDKFDDDAFVNKVKHYVVDCVNSSSLTIKLARNTEFREARTFYDEVVDKDYDGVTLFSHTKAYTNFNDEKCDKKRLKEWIVGSYWINFSYLNEMELCLSYGTKNHNALFFGSFLTCTTDGKLLVNAPYSGSMFWTNMRNVRAELFSLGKPIPPISSRMSAEQFPGFVCYTIVNMLATTHDGFFVYEGICDFYGNDKNKLGPKDVLKDICPETFENYCTFEKEMFEKSGV